MSEYKKKEQPKFQIINDDDILGIINDHSDEDVLPQTPTTKNGKYDDFLEREYTREQQERDERLEKAGEDLKKEIAQENANWFSPVIEMITSAIQAIGSAFKAIGDALFGNDENKSAQNYQVDNPPNERGALTTQQQYEDPLNPSFDHDLSSKNFGKTRPAPKPQEEGHVGIHHLANKEEKPEITATAAQDQKSDSNFRPGLGSGSN